MFDDKHMYNFFFKGKYMYKINIDCIRVNGLDHTFNLLSVMYYYDLFYVNIKKLITYSTPYKNSQLMIFC
jgi:hypothetical protein